MDDKKKNWQTATDEDLEKEISRLGKLAGFFSAKATGRVLMQQAVLMKIREGRNK